MTVTIDATAPVQAPPAGRDTQPAERATSRHLAGADPLRAVAALAVIVVHTAHWALQDQGADRAVWYSVILLARFCVPAFVVLTGMVLAWRYGDQRLGGAFLLRRARRSIVPFLVWAPVFCVVDVFLTGEITNSWSGVRDWFLLGGGHLYYLILVPQLYVLMLLWPSQRRTAVRLAVLLLAVQVGLDMYRLYAPVGGGALRQAVLVHGFEQFPYWIGFFAAGVAAGRVLKARHGRGFAAWPFAVTVPLAAALLLWFDRSGMANPVYADGTGSFLRPLMVPYVFAICGAVVFGAPALLRHMPRVARATGVVSRHSLGIYVVHPLMLAGFGRLLAGGLHSHLPVSIAAVALLMAAVGASALLASVLLARTPLALTIGENRVRRHEREREITVLGRRAA